MRAAKRKWFKRGVRYVEILQKEGPKAGQNYRSRFKKHDKLLLALRDGGL